MFHFTEWNLYVPRKKKGVAYFPDCSRKIDSQETDFLTINVLLFGTDILKRDGTDPNSKLILSKISVETCGICEFLTHD